MDPWADRRGDLPFRGLRLKSTKSRNGQPLDGFRRSGNREARRVADEHADEYSDHSRKVTMNRHRVHVLDHVEGSDAGDDPGHRTSRVRTSRKDSEQKNPRKATTKQTGVLQEEVEKRLSI